MAGAQPNRRPTFFWQGLLIVLPVLTISVVGLTMIRRDRLIVEQDTRQAANELAHRVTSVFAENLASQLSSYDAFSKIWFKHQLEAACGSRPAETEPGYSELEQQWLAHFPGLDPQRLFPDELAFSRSGALVQPADYPEPPQTPQWFLELTPPQRSCWDDLLFSQNLNIGFTNALQAFMRSNPGATARVNAEFITMRRALQSEQLSQTMAAFKAFSTRCQAFQSEAGLPLPNLLAAEALRHLDRAGSAEKNSFLDPEDRQGHFAILMQWSLGAPSLLTPGLLDQVEALVQARADPSTQLRSTVHAARTIWSAQARSHEIAEIIRRHHALSEVDNTNFWFEAAATRWFCITDRIFATARSNGLDRPEAQGAYCRALVYPQQALTLLAQRALAHYGLSVPNYFELELILEGEPVPLAVAPNPIRQAPSGSLPQFGPGLVLAESQGLVSPEVTSSEIDPATAPPGAQGKSVRFAIRVRLTNPELLFVQQRQRSWLLTGLILSSGLAACVGLVAAYLSFHRQLRLNELKSNFVSSVSHELRAPIASVRIMAENLERGKISDPGRRQEYFRFIVQECRRLSSLIENVLDFSRIEQGRKQFEFEPLDVVALVHETVKPLEAYASERQVALVVIDGPGLAGQQSLELNADGKALQQALVNLIDNAVKHSSKGQTVTVGLDLAGLDAALGRLEPRHKKRLGTLFLWVEDQGEGIPAEEHQRIFERFYRVGSELRRQTPGVGIGLSIVKHVVEAHGGRVQVRSAIGHGSRFTIELPLSGYLEPKQKVSTPNET